MSTNEQPVTPEVTEELEAQKAKNVELESQKANLVDEITNDRKKRQDLEAEIERLRVEKQETPAPVTTPPVDPTADVKSEVVKALAELKSAESVSNKDIAFKQFIANESIYQPDNDPAGLKAEALKNKLARFNTDGLHQVGDFTEVIKDADRLLRQGDDNHGKTVDISEDGSSPRTSDKSALLKKNDLTDEENKLIEQNGMSIERFKDLKEKNPDMIETLLEY